jgi:hypothetical protein
MIVHSVTIIPRTMPVSLMYDRRPFLLFLFFHSFRKEMTNGRLNITVRDIGRGWIDSSQFPAYRVIYDQNQEHKNTEYDGEV